MMRHFALVIFLVFSPFISVNFGAKGSTTNRTVIGKWEDGNKKSIRFVPRRPLSSSTDNQNNNSNSAVSYYNYPAAKFVLPECASQQVCNAVYTRLNRIHSLCACPEKHFDPCSISFRSNDDHTIELITDNSGKALTLVKTCEPIGSVRECNKPQDWAILALQNIRTGKSHYLVTCRCTNHGILEGPIVHENPLYAKIPGIRVYGMVCHQRSNKKRRTRSTGFQKLVSRLLLPLNQIRQFLSERKQR